MDSDNEDNGSSTAAVPKVEDEAAKHSGPLVTNKAPEGDDEEEGVAWSDSDGGGKPEKEAMPEAEVVPVPEDAGPKRKRGKRKVMKKKTTKDDEGYLVTKEEAVWESFSESDHEPEKKAVGSQKGVFGKMQGSQKQSQASSQKSVGAKGAAKPKGDLRSFFGKK